MVMSLRPRPSDLLGACPRALSYEGHVRAVSSARRATGQKRQWIRPSDEGMAETGQTVGWWWQANHHVTLLETVAWGGGTVSVGRTGVGIVIIRRAGVGVCQCLPSRRQLRPGRRPAQEQTAVSQGRAGASRPHARLRTAAVMYGRTDRNVRTRSPSAAFSVDSIRRGRYGGPGGGGWP